MTINLHDITGQESGIILVEMDERGRRLGIGRTLRRLPIVERLDRRRAEGMELTK